MVLSISRKRACFYGAVAIAQSVGSSMRILPILPACKHDTFLSDRGGTQTCLQPATGIERPRPDAVRSGSVSRIQAVTASPHWAPWASGIFRVLRRTFVNLYLSRFAHYARSISSQRKAARLKFSTAVQAAYPSLFRLTMTWSTMPLSAVRQRIELSFKARSWRCQSSLVEYRSFLSNFLGPTSSPW